MLPLSFERAPAVGHVTVQVAAAHAPVEIPVAEHAFVHAADQVSFGGERRRGRQSEAGQRIQMRHAVGRHPQMQVQRGEVHRIGERAGQRDVHVAQSQIGLQRKWQRRVTQCQHAADLAAARGFGAAPGSVRVPAEVVGLTRMRCRCIAGFVVFHRDDLVERNRLAQRLHRDIQMQIEFAVIDAYRAAVEADLADVEFPVSATLRELELPVGTPALVAFDIDTGFEQLQRGNFDCVADQRQRREAEANLLDSREARIFRPHRIGDADVARREARPGDPVRQAARIGIAQPGDGEITVDRHRPADRGAEPLVQPRPRAVPVEQREEQDRHDDQRGDDHHDPDQDAPCERHALLHVRQG